MREKEERMKEGEEGRFSWRCRFWLSGNPGQRPLVPASNIILLDMG